VIKISHHKATSTLWFEMTVECIRPTLFEIGLAGLALRICWPVQWVGLSH